MQKFMCRYDYHCIVPEGTTDEEAREQGLPVNCLECEYYTIQTKEGREISYKEWEENQKQQERRPYGSV